MFMFYKNTFKSAAESVTNLPYMLLYLLDDSSSLR